MSQRWFVPFFALLLIGVTLLSTGCGGGSKAQLRVMQASPDESNLDVLVDGNVVSSDLSYEANTGYLSVSSGSHQLSLNTTGTSSSVLTTSLSVGSNTQTTVIAANFASSLSTIVLTDNNTTPTAGDIQLRVVNAAPGMGTVDVYIVPPGTDLSTVAPTITGLAFQSASSYQTITAGDYEVFFTLTGTRFAYIDTGSLSFSDGQIRTIVGLNNPSGGYTFVSLADFN